MSIHIVVDLSFDNSISFDKQPDNNSSTARTD